MLVVGYRLNRLDKPIFMAGPKPMRTVFGSHHRLDSCGIIFHSPENPAIASSKKGGGGSVAAPLFFLPKEHNRVTTKLAEETWEAIEAEITLGREAFEADLLRINARSGHH